MAKTASDFVKDLQRRLREYKTAQRRLSSTMSAFKASANVALPAGYLSTKDLWVNGNSMTMVATLTTNLSGANLGQVFIQPIYGSGNRCGYRFINGLDGAVNFTATVVANQSITLEVK